MITKEEFLKDFEEISTLVEQVKIRASKKIKELDKPLSDRIEELSEKGVEYGFKDIVSPVYVFEELYELVLSEYEIDYMMKQDSVETIADKYYNDKDGVYTVFDENICVDEFDGDQYEMFSRFNSLDELYTYLYEALIFRLEYIEELKEKFINENLDQYLDYLDKKEKEFKSIPKLSNKKEFEFSF
ncbi:MAG: hypothetical protein U9Q33_07190 [Campylobacterota bacterium]|nr:hypothetical protein [Campylobacterota bacterium]